MSDKKISQLTGSTTPLAGTEELPVVQSGVTKKVSVANLTSGRSVSTGNLTVGGTFDLTPDTNGLITYGRFAAGYPWVLIRPDANATGIEFRSNAGAAQLAITQSSGDVSVFTGNLVIGTAGKGIDFSADGQAAGMTSELLDDYEEGTFTPVVATTSGAITSYTSSGTYTKIGRMVYVSISITITDNGTGAGTLSASLPFASAVPSTSLGREANATGTTIQVVTYAAATTVDLFTLSNAYPAATGYGFLIGFSYSV